MSLKKKVWVSDIESVLEGVKERMRKRERERESEIVCVVCVWESVYFTYTIENNITKTCQNALKNNYQTPNEKSTF